MFLITICFVPFAIAMEFLDEDQQLINAVKAGDLDKVEMLLVEGVNPDESVNWSNPVGPLSMTETALFVAIKAENASMVELLLKNGANPNIFLADQGDFDIIEHPQTPLSIVTKKGNIDLVRLLLAHKANISANIPDFGSCTLLHLAAMQGHAEIVEFLIHEGLDRFRQTFLGSHTAHSLAVINSKKESILPLFITFTKSEENKIRCRVMSLLLCVQRMHVASAGNDPWQVKCLESDIVTKPDLRLKQARKLITKELINILIQERLIEINHMLIMQDANGNTAMASARARGNQDIIDVLDLNDSNVLNNIRCLIKIRINQIMTQKATRELTKHA